MPAWITITVANLEDARVADLVTALRQEALGGGQTDPAPRFIQDIVDEVRRCIAKCPTTPLDSDEARVPKGLKGMVVAKILRSLKGRLLLPLTDDEKDEEKLYQRRLEQLIACEWPVDLPDIVAPAPTVAPKATTPAIKPRDRKLTRETADGI